MVVQKPIANLMGMAKFQHPFPRGSKTPEWFSTKLAAYIYVTDMTTHANTCGAATMWVVSANM